MKDTGTMSANKRTAETYIDFLTQTLGASREEVLEVSKHSGISARRIAEYLLKQKTRSSEFSDDE
jgi:hypothetical protein